MERRFDARRRQRRHRNRLSAHIINLPADMHRQKTSTGKKFNIRTTWVCKKLTHESVELRRLAVFPPPIGWGHWGGTTHCWTFFCLPLGRLPAMSLVIGSPSIQFKRSPDVASVYLSIWMLSILSKETNTMGRGLDNRKEFLFSYDSDHYSRHQLIEMTTEPLAAIASRSLNIGRQLSHEVQWSRSERLPAGSL